MSKREAPLAALKRLVKEKKTQAAAAKHLGITQQYLCDLLHGRRGFSDQIAKKLGFKRIWVAVD